MMFAIAAVVTLTTATLLAPSTQAFTSGPYTAASPPPPPPSTTLLIGGGGVRHYQHHAFMTSTTSKTTTARFLSSESESSSTSPSLPPTPPLTKMPHEDDKMPFYALGTSLAFRADDCVPFTNLKSVLEADELEIVIDAFCTHMRGDRRRREGIETLEQQNERTNTILTKYGEQFNIILNDRMKRILDQVKQDGNNYIIQFLKENPDAIQTDSGMVYCERVPGTGRTPTLESTVEVHYQGTLTDGTIVDSSIERGETTIFPLNGGVIPGWTEGLQRMKVGGQATLVIPSELAYGDAGSGGVIPPGATLKFDVQLFQVVDNNIPPTSGGGGDGTGSGTDENVEEQEMYDATLPDGTTISLPKGVKIRMIDQEEEEEKEKEEK